MRAVAILASDNMIPGHPNERADAFERDLQLNLLISAFARQQMKISLVRWREAAERAHEFQAMLPLFAWDYFEGNEQAFFEQMERAAGRTRVLNNVAMMKWNASKSYLSDLADRGLPVIPTKTVDRVNEENVTAAFAEFSTDALVIKPQIGGGAWRQVLLRCDDEFPTEEKLPPAAALIQAYLPGVCSEGEYSLLIIDGEYSHAAVKRPKSGDYRIQSIYGGTEEAYHPSDTEIQTAKRVVASLDVVPLYARVDLLRGQDGELKLIELELIEPYLYLTHATGAGDQNAGAEKIAAALSTRLR
jgi:glutathione synthase/RimK-type ligase-like ATP-grasp enzyme